MNPWDNDPVDQPLRVEINGTAADEPTEPWNADPVDAGPDVRAGTLPAVDSDQDKVAQARALSQATGIPASIIEEDPAPAERRVKLQKLDEAAAADPAVAKVLADPETAKLAHDDVENLSLVGETVRSFGRFFGAIGAAVPQVNAGLWGVIRAGADVVGADSVAGYAAERAGEQAGFVEYLRPKTGNWLLDTTYGGITSAAQSAMLAPAGMVGMLTGFGLTSGGEAYGQARDAGKGVWESLAFGASQGTIEAGTEMLPASAFLRMMKGEAGGTLLRTIKEFASKEAIGEQVATLLQDLNEWAVLNPEKSLREFAAERPGRAAETLIATVVSVGASTTAAQAVQAYGERAQAAQQAAQQAEQLLKASEASQLRARDPEAFRNFLRDASTDEAGDESTFFIDGRAFAQAIGSTGVSFEEFRAKAPELAQQMIEAVQTGGDVEIPVADFATAFAGTQEGATLLQHVRTSADAASAAEAAVFAQTQPEVLQQELEKALTAAQGEEVARSSESTVRERILQQLQSTGRYNGEVAGINAQVAASMFTALGAKMGRTAEQVMADFPLRIVGENPAAPGEVLQATDDPQFRAWFGDSKAVEQTGGTSSRDAKFSPQRMYHTTRKSFDKFEVGRPATNSTTFGDVETTRNAIFVTPDAGASAAYGTQGGAAAEGANTMPLYVKAENPLDLTSGLTEQDEARLLAAGLDSRFIHNRLGHWEVLDGEEGKALVETLKTAGYDSVIFNDENPDTGDAFESWAVFDPTQIKSVFNRGTWDGNDPNVLNQTPAALPMWALARAKGARITDAVRKAAISLSPKASLARRNYDKLDAIFAKVPDPLESEEAWNKFMSLLVADRDVLGVPYNALKYAQSPEAVAEYLSRLRPDQIESRRAGFALGAKIRATYANGTASPVTTGRLLLWAMLSRKAGAYPHEAAYMDLVNGGVDQWIQKAVSGKWTAADTKGYEKWSSEFMASKKGGISPAAGVTSNANDFGRILLTKMSAKDDSGKTALQRLHDLIADQSVSTDQVRREFFALGDNLGIQNKVLSFALLVTGRWDTLVLDRVQFTHLWGDTYRERAGQRNIYDLGLAAAGEGHFGLAVYEALSRGMTDSVAKGYALAGLTGEGDGTLGAFHWDSWLIESSQAIGHPTIEALDTDRPRADLAVRQGKFDTYGYNFEYRADGQYQIPLLEGGGYVILSPAEARAFQGRISDPKEGVVPKGFGVATNKTAPWVYAEGVNRGRYDQILAEYGRRAAAGDVAPAGLADAGGPVQQPATDDAADGVLNQSVVPLGIDLADRTAADVGGVVLNVGLADPAGGPPLTEEQVTKAIEGFGVRVVRSKRYQSNTEPTMVARLSRELTPAEAHELSESLGQEAIVQMVGHRGALHGPKKENWGEFNPDFFITLDGKPASQIAGATFAQSVPTPTVGYHFSNGPRTLLDGRQYGTNGAGEERARVARSDDPRIKSRVYAYIDWGNGIRPEGQVGSFAHEIALPALYDFDADPLRLRVAGDANATESAILDAGFGGYFVREFGTGQGAAVILGEASQGIPARPATPARGVAVATRTAPTKYRTPLMSKEIEAIDMADVQAAAPSAKLSAGTFSVDVGDLPAAREVLSKFGVALPETSLNQESISFLGFGDVENNASGESAASLEAQSRVESERRQGRTRVVVDKAGSVRPLVGVDAVDQRAYPGQVILQRGVGRGEWTVLDAGDGVTEGDRARAISRAEAALAQRQEAPRGTFNPSTLTISLLEKADLSTFLHELGHFGLEMMVEIAAQPGAPQTVIDDVRIILDWFGVKDIQTWRAMTLEQQRPYHEKFAEGFETYLFEGKSPSADLNTAFARVAAWMLNVYKSLTSMRVKLTPEVRGVFDRMLATNDQIAEQSRLRSMAPMFESAEQAGMSAKDWADYQEVGAQAARDAVADLRSRTLRDMRWLSNAKGRALKKLQDSAKEARRGVRAEVEAQVDAQPVYAAMAFIEHGALAERDLTNAQRKALDTVAGGKTKLSLPALKDLYGTDPAAPWRYIKQTMVAAEDGAHPDAVAEAFGFDSGDALVRAILAAEPRQQLVEALTDKRMLEEHADLSDPAQIELAAEAAIHNEARIRFVATEMKALQDGMSAREKVGETKVGKGKQAGQVRAITVDGLVRAASQYAEAIVGRTVVRRLNPTKHARAAANEAKAAAEAMKKGDLQEALAHKRNQLLHERTSRMMSEAVTEFEKHLGYLRKFRRSNRARGAIDADYVEQIENLLNAVDTRQASNKRLESLASLRKWIAAQEAEGLPVALDPELIESLQIPNVRDLTVEQLRALVDQVRSIEHLGKLKKKLLTARDKREFDAIADELAASIREHGGKPRDVPFAPGAAEHTGRRLWAGFFAEHRKLASLAREMDGVVDDGPLWRALIRSMNDAGNRETARIADSTKVLGAIFKPLTKLKGGLTGDKRLIPSLGQSLSRGERMAVLLNWGNEHGRQRVLNTVPAPAVAEIMQTMSREEALAIQAVWDHVNEYWPDIAAKEKRVTGTVPEKVDAVPFTIALADGTTIDLRGGYYPIVYESEMSDVAAAHEQAQIAKEMQAGAYTRATTRRGHTKKRAEKVGEPLRFTLDVIERHISQVVHDLAWHEWLIDAGRLLRDKRISSAIRDHYGPATLKAMKDALSDIATGDLQRMSRVEALVATGRARVSAAMMGWSATTALLQPFGLFQSIPRVGAIWIARGMKHWAGDTLRLENSARIIREKSAMMRHRSTTFNRDIREITNRIHRGKGVVSEVFDASLFVAMQKMQLIADIPTWWGAYEKAMAESTDEGRAVALADQAVLDAQGGGQVKDLAGVQRGNELKSALSMFYSYFSATWNLAAESTARTNFRKPAQVAGWLADMVVLSVMPVLAQQIVFALVRGGDDDEDKDWAERAMELSKALGSFWLNTLIGVREFSGMVQGFEYNGPAAARALVEAGNLGKTVKKAVDPDEELDDADYRRATKSVLTLLGWPAAQIDRSWRGWQAYKDGEAGPGGVILGPPPKD